MDYTTLSLAEVKTGLDAVARDTEATFGGLDARQLNWRPDPAQWSVAQCFEHLLTSNRLMLVEAERAMDAAQPRTIWQRLPILPGILGRLLVRSQAPETKRKMTSPTKARPAASDVGPDIIQRFIDQTRDCAARVSRLDEAHAARAIMPSPFLNLITYSVLDGWRLMLAHDRRHFEQARRVTSTAGFPGQAVAT
jgi:hypothetical protein